MRTWGRSSLAFGVNQKGRPEGRADPTLTSWGLQVTPFMGGPHRLKRSKRPRVGVKGCFREGEGHRLGIEGKLRNSTFHSQAIPRPCFLNSKVLVGIPGHLECGL